MLSLMMACSLNMTCCLVIRLASVQSEKAFWAASAAAFISSCNPMLGSEWGRHSTAYLGGARDARNHLQRRRVVVVDPFVSLRVHKLPSNQQFGRGLSRNEGLLGSRNTRSGNHLPLHC